MTEKSRQIADPVRCWRCNGVARREGDMFLCMKCLRYIVPSEISPDGGPEEEPVSRALHAALWEPTGEIVDGMVEYRRRKL